MTKKRVLDLSYVRAVSHKATRPSLNIACKDIVFLSSGMDVS